MKTRSIIALFFLLTTILGCAQPANTTNSQDITYNKLRMTTRLNLDKSPEIARQQDGRALFDQNPATGCLISSRAGLAIVFSEPVYIHTLTIASDQHQLDPALRKRANLRKVRIVLDGEGEEGAYVLTSFEQTLPEQGTLTMRDIDQELAAILKTKQITIEADGDEDGCFWLSDIDFDSYRAMKRRPTMALDDILKRYATHNPWDFSDDLPERDAVIYPVLRDLLNHALLGSKTAEKALYQYHPHRADESEGQGELIDAYEITKSTLTSQERQDHFPSPQPSEVP